jgi:hypothetical protein
VQLALAQWRMGAGVEASHTIASGGKGDLSSTNSTSLFEQQGESSSPEERSGMGTRGTSEPWGRIPRSVGLTRGAAAPCSVLQRTDGTVIRTVTHGTGGAWRPAH